MVSTEEYNKALEIIEKYEEQLRIGGVINCTDCNKLLAKDSESNTCTECFYKDRYKYS
jgi:hypothetical protein